MFNPRIQGAHKYKINARNVPQIQINGENIRVFSAFVYHQGVAAVWLSFEAPDGTPIIILPIAAGGVGGFDFAGGMPVTGMVTLRLIAAVGGATATADPYMMLTYSMANEIAL